MRGQRTQDTYASRPPPPRRPLSPGTPAAALPNTKHASQSEQLPRPGYGPREITTPRTGLLLAPPPTTRDVVAAGYHSRLRALGSDTSLGRRLKQPGLGRPGSTALPRLPKPRRLHKSKQQDQARRRGVSGVYRHSNKHAPRRIPEAQYAFKGLMIH